MLTILIRKELKAILLSPKFPAAFGVASALIILSFAVGLNEYRASVRQYETATQLAGQELRERSSWAGLSTRAFRRPNPMQIFVSGVQNDIGRWSVIGGLFAGAVRLRHSLYEDDPIYAVFRFLDLPFIVQIVLSLLAILYTYDTINGERESGTLSLVFSNAVPRTTYILAKCLGSWLGLMLPLALPFAIGLLVVVLGRPPLTPAHWGAVGLLLAASALYCTLFVMIGVFSSALTQRSGTSFFLCMSVWLLSVLIIPGLGVTLAGRMMPVPSIEEVEAQQAQYARDRWTTFEKEVDVRWESRMASMRALSREEEEAYRQAHAAEWMAEEDKARQQAEQDISEHDRQLQAGLRNLRAEQERLAFQLTRLSPAAAYQHAAIALADADVALKYRYEEAMHAYRTRFTETVNRKMQETGGRGVFNISVGTNGQFSFRTPGEIGAIDASVLPAFEAPPFASAVPVADLGLLGALGLLGLAGSLWRFQRYDVR